MRIVITGVTGYIGGQLAKKLAHQHELFLISRNQWDFNQPLPIDAFPKQADAIIHCAQARNYRDIAVDTTDMFTVNTKSTLELAQYALKAGAKHFCYISSGSVYSSSQNYLKEDESVNPNTMLGATKLAGEILLKPFENHFSLSILRLFTPYGPGQIQRLVPNLIEKIKSKQVVSITGDEQGSCFGMIYIDDVINTIEKAVTENWQGIYNIAAENKISIRKICEIISQKFQLQPLFDFNKQQSKICLCPDTTKLSQKLDTTQFLRFDRAINFYA